MRGHSGIDRAVVRTAGLMLGALALSVAAFVGSVGTGDPGGSARGSFSTATKLASAGAVQGAAQPPSSATYQFEIDWPQDGQPYAPLPGDTIRGYVSAAGAPVVVEMQDASGNWVQISPSTLVSALVPSSVGAAGTTPAYAWAMPAQLPTWANAQAQLGGALRFRATAYPNWSQFGSMGIPKSFDLDGPACLASAYATQTWTQAAASCSSTFPLYVPTTASAGSAVTALSTTLAPIDISRNVGNPARPTYISMVQPVSNQDVTQTSPGPYLPGQGYYQVIQPPTTLTAFKAKYGFNSSGTGPYANGEVESTYYNKGDLGIGRNMHCKRFVRLWWPSGKEKGLACYVKNYAKRFNGETQGLFFGEDEDTVLDATIAKISNNHFATVAMVQVDGSPRVDFIAYDDTGSLTPAAKLDRQLNNLAVPTNCLSCHGGSYDGWTSTTGGIANNARFLPFDSDPRVLKFPTTNSAFTLAAQATNIRDLNMMIYNSPMTTASVKKQITLMYGGNENAAAPGPVYTNGFVPTTWQASAQTRKLYREVVHPYCIGCHLSWPNPNSINTQPQYDPFASESNFAANWGSIYYDICQSHRMPAANQTASMFWTSPGRAYLLNHYGSASDKCNP